MTEDKMVGWHTDSMNMSLGEFRELVMDREACLSLCCGSWGPRELDTTE